jgi:ferredoxin
MRAKASTRAGDRVVERRRAVALARHYREAEGLSIVQIADRLGRSPAPIKAYFYDPIGEKARAVKVRYQGVCRGCGAYTQPRNGKGDACAYCKACHPGAIERRWTRERYSRRCANGAHGWLVALLLRLVARTPRWGRGPRATARDWHSLGALRASLEAASSARRGLQVAKTRGVPGCSSVATAS